MLLSGVMRPLAGFCLGIEFQGSHLFQFLFPLYFWF